MARDATRPVFRPRRQDRTARQARPAACARCSSTRSATTRRRATRCTSTGRSSSCATPRTASCYGVYYDTLSAATFDFGREFDNYHGFYRYGRDRGRRSRLLRVRRARRMRDVVRKFAELTGPMALPPRWTLGFANTAMGLADAPDAQAQIVGVPRRAARHDDSAVGVPLRLRLHEPRQAALRVHVESRQVSRSAGRWSRQFEAAGVNARRQPQALPARRSSGVRRGRGASAASSSDARRRAVRRPVLGRLGRARRLHAIPAGIAWWQRGLRRADPRLRHRRRLERQQRVRDLGRGRRVARLRRADADRALAAAARAADDARERGGAGAHARRTSASTR